jgi:5-methylcytosine-specific restriction protein B
MSEYLLIEEIRQDILNGVRKILELWDDADGQSENKTHKGENVLIYGVPGSGKSYTINSEYPLLESESERVVFHPDYSYSDFVGQITPLFNEISGKIEYPFVAGPFTRLLKKAIDSSELNKMHFLVIEEINRGNAPAIFGDLFQLLDRNPSGESVYAITNYQISKILYNGNIDVKIKIPNNFIILATMNTSDQNVFTLDTAFKRRWKMRMIVNDFDSVSFATQELFGTTITWKAFAEKINDKVINSQPGMLSNEDKRLGAYFITETEINDVTLFAEKVLMYLWNDVFRYDRTDVFIDTYKSLDQLISDFKLIKFKVFQPELFE